MSQAKTGVSHLTRSHVGLANSARLMERRGIPLMGLLSSNKNRAPQAEAGAHRSKTGALALAFCRLSTPDGEFQAWFSPAGLARLTFPGEIETQSALKQPTANPVASSEGEDPVSAPAAEAAAAESRERWHSSTLQAILRILAGGGTAESVHEEGGLPPLDLQVWTAFQQAVWRELIRIPPGQTRTYGEVARAIGNPGAVRAVGGACGANPIPLIIPCHRVLAAGNRIGGFSGGLPWKRLLLSREGVRLEPSPQPEMFD